jgi:hypothetical protein
MIAECKNIYNAIYTSVSKFTRKLNSKADVILGNEKCYVNK